MHIASVFCAETVRDSPSPRRKSFCPVVRNVQHWPPLSRFLEHGASLSLVEYCADTFSAENLAFSNSFSNSSRKLGRNSVVCCVRALHFVILIVLGNVQRFRLGDFARKELPLETETCRLWVGLWSCRPSFWEQISVSASTPMKKTESISSLSSRFRRAVRQQNGGRANTGPSTYRRLDSGDPGRASNSRAFASQRDLGARC